MPTGRGNSYELVPKKGGLGQLHLGKKRERKLKNVLAGNKAEPQNGLISKIFVQIFGTLWRWTTGCEQVVYLVS